jgi:acetyl-CoA carboxylase alpha subunit
MPIKARYSVFSGEGAATVFLWSENAKALNDDKLMEITQKWKLLLGVAHIKDMNVG